MRDWHLAPAYIARMFGDSALFKFVVAAALTSAEYLFGTDVTRNAAIAAAGLMCLDTVTGMVAAWFTGQGFQSGKFSRVLTKIVSYGSAVIVAAVATHHLPGLSAFHDMSVTTVVSLILCTEALSIMENIDKLGFKSFGFIRVFLAGKIKALQAQSKEPEKPDDHA
jgi:phage-related holin